MSWFSFLFYRYPRGVCSVEKGVTNEGTIVHWKEGNREGRARSDREGERKRKRGETRIATEKKKRRKPGIRPQAVPGKIATLIPAYLLPDCARVSVGIGAGVTFEPLNGQHPAQLADEMPTLGFR